MRDPLEAPTGCHEYRGFLESNNQIGRMYSKRIRLFVQIIGFLFCTIGLLYISMKITSTEGFQTLDTAPNCKQYNSFDKIYWLCTTDNEAQAQVRILISTGDIFSGACYQTTAGFYTCYTRPSQKSYDSADGIFLVDDPYTDGMPAGIESDITTVCGDYATTMATFSTIYISTLAIGNVLNSTITRITDATKQLGGVSTKYCYTTLPGSAARSDAKQHACDTLSTGISIFNGIPGGAKGLNYMSTTVFTALTNMDDLYANHFTKAYKGFGYSTCSNIVGFQG